MATLAERGIERFIDPEMTNKRLLDPYARAIGGRLVRNPAMYSHKLNRFSPEDDSVRDERDSAPYVPYSVVTASTFDWSGDVRPNIPWADTVVYEAHVKSMTKRHPDVPAELRGTYAGLAHDSVIAHLQSLGVTSLELLPIHQSLPEEHLVDTGMTNYWGYNTIGFFAPHMEPRCASVASTMRATTNSQMTAATTATTRAAETRSTCRNRTYCDS